MTPLTETPALFDQAWQEAIAQTNEIFLPDTLWIRPKVQGITIDRPSPKDLAHAIWMEATPTGAKASIHIADVAEIVAIGTALDKVTLARTQTRYFGKVLNPMLPPALSEKLSLLKGKRRPTLTVQISLNENTEIQSTEIFESWIICNQCFSYEEADQTCTKKKTPFHKRLKLCQVWAERLNLNRRSKGALGGLFNKSGILLDENGKVVNPDGKLFHSQMIIQEFMILANRATAQWLVERDVLALFLNQIPREAAPEQQDLLQDLITTGNLEMIQKKRLNWLNKPEYNPAPTGHFALQLNAYCHFTNPFQSLAALVNHRIIKALINGQNPPYQHSELEQLCQYIATIRQKIDREVFEFHKARTQKLFSTQLMDPTSVETLAEREFTNVLKHALRVGNLMPIREAAIARLEQGKLTLQDLFLLLIKSSDREIQQKVLPLLKEKPHHSPCILAITIDQEDAWERFDYVEGNQTPPFWYWTEVLIGGQLYTTQHPAQNAKKQQARNLACLHWLEAFVNGALVAPEQREQPKPPIIEIEAQEPQPATLHPILTQTLSDGQNMIGLLQEFCQISRWDLPIYQFSEAEDGFACTCKVSAWGRSFKGKANAAKKKRAKHLAAMALLEQIQQWVKKNQKTT